MLYKNKKRLNDNRRFLFLYFYLFSDQPVHLFPDDHAYA